ncbi:uncharacterized protein LOC133744229 [Rosa rugosa]|uniref:uncharacterized protein LOC133744229 n=1 Tax=Rosa rugosa TaxID=74645 RepID=UPI002B413400|nr:uncharacterized protein LOC133744229 [Rosa rugosa]
MPIGPLSGPPPAQSTLALVDLPDWAKEIDSVDATEEGYDAWWAEVSVNCWRQQHDEVFAAIFGELRYPYAADVDQLARIPEDAAQASPPAAKPAPRPAQAPRQAQAGIVILEPLQEGSSPLSGSRAANASQAADQSGKQKAVMIEPEDKESSSSDDDMQTIAALSARKRARSDPRTDLWAEDEPIADRLVRHRSSRHAEEGSSTVGEGTSASQAPAPTVVNHSPPPAGAVDNAQLASIPVQIIDDSSPEAENRVLLLDAPREEPSDVPVLEQTAPDSIPVPSEASPETMLAIIVYEPPIEEVPNVVGTGDDVIGAVEAEAAEPVPNVVDRELPPPAPQVAEAEELEDLPEPVPEVPIAEPPEAPVAEPPTPSTLERLARVLEVTPPGVVDEVREGLRRFLGPDILIPGAPVRVLEYLRMLLREGAITEEQFQEIDQLLQDLPQGLNERAVANAQARQTEMHYQNLTQQTETARDFLGYEQKAFTLELSLELVDYEQRVAVYLNVPHP